MKTEAPSQPLLPGDSMRLRLVVQKSVWPYPQWVIPSQRAQWRP